MTKPDSHGHDQHGSCTDTISLTSMGGNHAEYVAKVAAFAALSGAGIARVVARFDGEGGNGQIADVDACGADGSASCMPTADLAMQEAVFEGPAVTFERRLRGAIDIMSYALLEQTHGRRDAGAGGLGDSQTGADVSRCVVRSIRGGWNGDGGFDHSAGCHSGRCT